MQICSYVNIFMYGLMQLLASLSQPRALSVRGPQQQGLGNKGRGNRRGDHKGCPYVTACHRRPGSGDTGNGLGICSFQIWREGY